FEKAVKVLNRTLDNHPTADETLAAEANLCLAHTYLANYETAMDACNRALALRPVHWQSLVNRGNLYAMNGEAKAAIGDYRAAIKSGGDAPTISRLIVRTEKAIAQAAVE
ncbi:MAG: tetratricopeptide repeat protein, partial [Pseudomonadota bacterium]